MVWSQRIFFILKLMWLMDVCNKEILQQERNPGKIIRILLLSYESRKHSGNQIYIVLFTKVYDLDWKYIKNLRIVYFESKNRINNPHRKNKFLLLRGLLGRIHSMGTDYSPQNDRILSVLGSFNFTCRNIYLALMESWNGFRWSNLKKNTPVLFWFISRIPTQLQMWCETKTI